MTLPGLKFVAPPAPKGVAEQLAKAGLTGRSGEIVEAFQALFRQKPEDILFTWRRRGELTHLTYGDFQQAVIAFKDELIDCGFKKGDRLLLLSESRAEWCQAFLSVSMAEGIVVPVDPRLTVAEVQSILEHSEPRFVLYSPDCSETALKLTLRGTKLYPMVSENLSGVLHLRNTERTHRHVLKERDLEDPIVIAYTSGTSGNPKGVMLSLRNIWFEVVSLTGIFGSRRNDVMLSMLPLNHLLELAGGYLSALMVGARIVFAGSYLPNELLDWMETQKVTRMITVPLFLEQLKKAIEREVAKQSWWKRTSFKALLKVSPLCGFCFRRIVLFPGITRKFGGRLRLFICGGAPLSAETARFFELLGMRVLQGYGLTETSPVVTVNRVDKNRHGSVGVPLDTVRVRIDNPNEHGSGEIVVRGPNVMKGYFRNETATTEVLSEDGWFRTGDVGHVDSDGFLWITGRVKSVVVLPGGKNVFLEEVDEPLCRCPHFLEACAIDSLGAGIGDKSVEKVVAVVRPFNQEATQEEVEEQVAEAVAQIAPYKRPSSVIVLFREFPRTATRKIKKHELKKLLKEENKL